MTTDHDRDLLDLAIRVATEAHADQVDKSGKPYIDHPLRVMRSVRALGATTMTVAVLHDVVEDTEIGLGDLRRLGFTEEVVKGVEAVSRRAGEPYMAYIARCAADPIGESVKRADLADNMDPSRRFPGSESLMRRYKRSIAFLDNDRAKRRADGGAGDGLEAANEEFRARLRRSLDRNRGILDKLSDR